jgi:hypothetical protein
MNDLPPLETPTSFYARIESLSEEEKREEYETWATIKKLYRERGETDHFYESMKKQGKDVMRAENKQIDDAISKLKSKIAVATETLSQTYVVDTAGDEFMMVKWQSDKSECMADYDRKIQTQEDQIAHMRQAFESKLMGVQSNLEAIRNNRMKKEEYFNARIKATNDRIELAQNKHKTPAIIKMELEVKELEGKKHPI